MTKLALALIFASLIGCSSTFAHKAVTVEGNKTIGAGVTLNKSGLTLSGVTQYASTTAPIERERAKVKALELEILKAQIRLAEITAATGGTP